MPLIDYRWVREQVSMEKVLELIGYEEVKGTHVQRYGPCPLKCSDRGRCCSFNLPRKIWRCHNCGSGGNHLDLFCRVYSLDVYTGALSLLALSQIEIPWKEFAEALSRSFPTVDYRDWVNKVKGGSPDA